MLALSGFSLGRLNHSGLYVSIFGMVCTMVGHSGGSFLLSGSGCCGFAALGGACLRSGSESGPGTGLGRPVSVGHTFTLGSWVGTVYVSVLSIGCRRALGRCDPM